MLKSCLKYSLCFTLRALYPSRALRTLYARFTLRALYPSRALRTLFASFNTETQTPGLPRQLFQGLIQSDNCIACLCTSVTKPAFVLCCLRDSASSLSWGTAYSKNSLSRNLLITQDKPGMLCPSFGPSTSYCKR